MGNVYIIKIGNTDKNFYKLMGPFLSKREIAKELGNNVWDDDGKTWFVAVKDKEVCGFVAAARKKNNVVFGSDYILPDHRDQGIYKSLFATRNTDYQCDEITAMVTDGALPQYMENGFIITGKRGKYYAVKRVPN